MNRTPSSGAIEWAPVPSPLIPAGTVLAEGSTDDDHRAWNMALRLRYPPAADSRSPFPQIPATLELVP